MRSSSYTQKINIAASTQRLDVDNRISLRFYSRVADNILKQADIFRHEKNVIDLYVMLLRFSSLVSETIPCHRDYRASTQREKVSLKKKLLNALSELEELKPVVKQKIDDINRSKESQLNGWEQCHSIESSPVKKQSLTLHGEKKVARPAAQDIYQGPRVRHFSHATPVEEHIRRLSLTIPRPKEETLSRHSILGPNGLNGQWRLPSSDKGVRYPSDIDLTPIEIPSLQQSVENGSVIKLGDNNSEQGRQNQESFLPQIDECQTCHAEEPSLISFESKEASTCIDIIRQPSPPPVLAEVQDLIPAGLPRGSDADCMTNTPSAESYVHAETPLQLHISTTMMESFMKLAKSNTDKHLETCGVLAGSLKNRKFYVTALIIPKQESTSDSCQTTNEEEIFDVQDKRSLFPLGWIHTHPTQSCFMSSIDLHTHYSYQIMLPEAVAIVMAPRDTSRKHGIFRLTAPGGMSIIRQCQQRGFHPHDQPPDGGPIYKTCTDVYMNPGLNFEVIDLR